MLMGDVLRNLLENNCITQKQLAAELNIAAPTIGNYVRNLREPDFETLKSIADYFNVTVDYLLDHHTKSTISHDEDTILSIYRALGENEKRLFLEQGKTLLKFTKQNPVK